MNTNTLNALENLLLNSSVETSAGFDDEKRKTPAELRELARLQLLEIELLDCRAKLDKPNLDKYRMLIIDPITDYPAAYSARDSFDLGMFIQFPLSLQAISLLIEDLRVKLAQFKVDLPVSLAQFSQLARPALQERYATKPLPQPKKDDDDPLDKLPNTKR